MIRLFTISILLFFAIGLNAQEIPNPGFENWTNNTPNDWFPNNQPTGPQCITPSSDSHSGALSAQLEVVEFAGFPFPPVLSAGATGSGFAVSQRYEALNGYYKFSPQSGDYIGITVQMWVGGTQGTLIGSGALTIPTAASGWTTFSVPIGYLQSGTPDWCTVQIIVGINQSIGGYALLDDLSFGSTNAVKQINSLVPDEFEITQNYPNPFNPTTNIEYSLPEVFFVELKVYDILGNEVATLVNEEQVAGVYRADFDASRLTSGVYIARISAGNFTKAIKMNLVR